MPTSEKSSGTICWRNAAASFFFASIRVFSVRSKVCSSGLDVLAGGSCATPGIRGANKKKIAQVSLRTFMRFLPIESLSNLLRKSGKPIDTFLVLFLPIRLQAFYPTLARPGLQLCALALILKKRNAVATRILDARDFDDNDRPCMLGSGKRVREDGELRLVRLDHAAMSIEAENVGWTLKRAKHQDDSAVLFQVGDGLHSAAVVIQVGDGGRPENAKCVLPLRRQVDVSVRIERSGGDEENFLRLDETPGG